MTLQSEVYISVEYWLRHLQTVIPSCGGAITVDALVRRLEATGAFPAEWTRHLKTQVVRRVLEFLPAVIAKRRVRAWIRLNEKTGRVLTPRPRGIPPVGDEVIFFPRMEG